MSEMKYNVVLHELANGNCFVVSPSGDQIGTIYRMKDGGVLTETALVGKKAGNGDKTNEEIAQYMAFDYVMALRELQLDVIVVKLSGADQAAEALKEG